jgi:Predicted P-loop ATPase and inactivated derivatives
MVFKVSVGNSRMDKVWKAREMSWEDFILKVSNTVRTSETVEEYKKLGKAKQDAIKDTGGFVAGSLKGGRRKADCVITRSMLTLDMDYAGEDIWQQVTMFNDFACCIYSTHKHTPEKPRIRLIIPLKREISPDEYMAVARKVAEDIGMDQFDDTTYEPSRLMYWPSTSADGEFIFEKQEGDYLDPDTILNKYKNWHDSSEWPVSSRQETIMQRAVKKQADPLTKPGIVGAFCRTYTMTEAITTFLSDIYQPSLMEGRFDYALADSTAGVVLYEQDKFCYSNHATDPASSKLCNAFDIVRLQKFGELDDKSSPDTDASKLPSFKAMQDFCINDDKVKLQLAKERELQASNDFEVDDENWQARLELNKDGGIKDTLSNIVEILRHDTRLQSIAFNEHRNGIDIRNSEEIPWTPLKEGWSDSDLAAAKVYFDRVYKLWSPSKFKDALVAVSAERAFHPIKEYFDTLPEWNGVERMDRLLIDYLGAEDNSYTRAVIRKTLVAAVARIYAPGTKFDYILVLNGPQGIGKSTFFSRLGGRWFSDSLTISDMRDKAAAEKLQGYWILELGELAGIKKMDVETVKSFISRTDDKYRAAYGTVVESHPRQCVIVGSTNSTGGFLRDITGNRRFWPVFVSGAGTLKPWQLTHVDQIWAEAIDRYKAGEDLVLTGEDAEIAYLQQQDAMENDDREGLVRDYLVKLLPDNWRSMDISERRAFLAGNEFGQSGIVGSVKRDKVCTMEIWCECFCKDASNMKKTEAYELNAIMSKIEGWKKYEGNKSGRVKFPIYGSQNAYSYKGD